MFSIQSEQMREQFMKTENNYFNLERNLIEIKAERDTLLERIKQAEVIAVGIISRR